MPVRLKYGNSVRCTVENLPARWCTTSKHRQRGAVSRQWVYQLRQSLEAFDTVSPPPLGVQGRPRKIHHDAEEGVKEFIKQNPTAYQDEIVEFPASEFEYITGIAM
jgi:hypothetical protein